MIFIYVRQNDKEVFTIIRTFLMCGGFARRLLRTLLASVPTARIIIGEQIPRVKTRGYIKPHRLAVEYGIVKFCRGAAKVYIAWGFNPRIK